MNFRNYFYEQTGKEPWFASIPMPRSIGNFLLAASNLSETQEGKFQESQWDKNPEDRGFPLSQPATDFFSTAPQPSKGNMTKPFKWLVTQGLYEALKKRRELAAKATAQIESGILELAPQFQGQELEIPDEVTEDMVYSKEAHQYFPELGKMIQRELSDPYAYEPSRPIEYTVGQKDNKLVSFTLQEANEFIEGLNARIRKDHKIDFNLFQPLKFSGYDGFIEHVENGSWAEKTFGTSKPGQPWRTRNGISLHNPKKLIQKTELDQGFNNYSFGDDNIMLPMRDDNADKFLAEFPNQIFNNFVTRIEKDIDKLPEENKKIAQMILQKIKDGKSIGQFAVDYKDRRLVNSDRSLYDKNFDDIPDYLANVFVAKLGLYARAAISNEISKRGGSNPSKEEIEQIANQAAKEIGFTSVIGSKATSAKGFFSSNAEQRFSLDQDGEPYSKGRKKLNPEFQISDNQILKGIEQLKNGLMPSIGSPKHYTVLASAYSTGHSYLKDLGDFNDLFNKLMKGVVSPDLEQAVKEEVSKISKLPEKVPAFIANTKGMGFGKEFENKRSLTVGALEQMLKPERYAFQPEANRVVDFTPDPNLPAKDQEPQVMNSSSLTPQQQKTNDNMGWSVIGGKDVLNTAKVIKLRKAGRENIILSRKKDDKGNFTNDWEYFDKIQSNPIDMSSSQIKKMLTSDKIRYSGGKVSGKSDNYSKDNINTDDFHNLFKNYPNNFGYENYDDYEKDIQRLATKLKDVNPTYNNTNEKIGYEGAYGLITDAMMKYMFTSSEFKQQFGDVSDPNYLASIKKVQDPGNYNPENYLKDLSQLKIAQKTNNFDNISEEELNFFAKVGREYRNTAVVKEFYKMIRNDSTTGGHTNTGENGEKTAVDYDSRAHADRIDQKTTADTLMKPGRGRSNVVGSFDTEVDQDNQSHDLSDYQPLETQTMRRERSMESDVRYVSAYKRQVEFMNDIDPNDLTKLKQAVNSNVGNIENSMIIGKLDATADKVLDSLRVKVAKKSPDLFDFVKNICPPLHRIYSKRDENISDHFADILGGYDLLEKAEEELEKEKKQFFEPEKQPQQQELSPAARTTQQMPQQPSSPTLNVSQPAPAPAPAVPVPVKKGLGSFMKRKTESYSFRTRYLRKLAEMAGATGAVYDGKKDFEGNWEGAVGHPLGVSIKGEVEDRQTNPDGKGKKRGKSK